MECIDCSTCADTSCVKHSRSGRDSRGLFVLGNQIRTGIGKRVTISNALTAILDEDKCHALAGMLVALALDGSTRALEMILERTEGKVAQQIVSDTEIIVLHQMPKPMLAIGELAAIEEEMDTDAAL